MILVINELDKLCGNAEEAQEKAIMPISSSFTSYPAARESQKR